MKTLIAATILAACIATPAFSADMAVKARPAPVVAAAYDWSGFYFGVAGGADFGHISRYHSQFVTPFTLQDDFTEPSGSLFAGVQKQFGVFVIGGEFDYFTNVQSEPLGSPPAAYNATILARGSIKDVLNVGGRLGYTGWTNWLIYGTGGYAHGTLGTNWEVVATGGPALVAEDASIHKDGWYAGAGVDYLAYKGTIADIIVGAEYRHIDLGSVSVSPSGAAVAITNYVLKGHEDIASLRVSFKLNPFLPAAVVAKY